MDGNPAAGLMWAWLHPLVAWLSPERTAPASLRRKLDRLEDEKRLNRDAHAQLIRATRRLQALATGGSDLAAFTDMTERLDRRRP